MADQTTYFYLQLAHCWDDQTFKCITTIFKSWKDSEENITTNHAVQTIDEAMAVIEMRMKKPKAGVYNALGSQKVAKSETYADGYKKAVRTRDNMHHFNSFFTDVDVKPGAYADTKEAALAIAEFCNKSGMPKPSMLVATGSGGLHPYWCTKEKISLVTWQPMAEALKEAMKQHGLITDAAVTADAARVLRIPGTYNWKSGQPVPVELIPPDEVLQYSIEALGKILLPYHVAQAKTGTGTNQSQASAWAQNFGTGVDDQRALPKVSIDDIAVNCPMTAATLLDGGKGKSEPEWSQDIFHAAWTSDPTDAAHRLSKGHVGYNPVATDKKLAEKLAAIAGNPKLGWPLCASFTHAACSTCPLLRLGKSPIYFVHSMAKQAAQPIQPGYQVDPLMPDGDTYWRNQNDHVFTMTTSGPVDVLGRPLLDGGINRETYELVFKFAIGNAERWGSLLPLRHTGAGICEALGKGSNHGILVPQPNQKIAMGFIMSWMTHLQNKKKYLTPSGFGWSGEGFVFGDQIYTATGPQVVYRGDTNDERYRPVGDLKPWQDALRMVYGNAPLETIVASAFASPLVAMACDHSVVLAVFSDLSGYGKSTAMKIAQSVWGNPRIGMSTLDDTENAVNKKVTSLRNLPVYWDELKLEEQKDKMVRVIFAATVGQTKARLSRDSSQMAIGMATTMFVVASNRGISDHVQRRTEGTDAGGMRVFEFEIEDFKSTMSAGEAMNLMLPLEHNYGNAGAVYADFIARNKKTAGQVVAAVREQLAPCKFTSKERFWEGTMVTLIAGAHLANATGLTALDVAAIQSHLIAALRKLRDVKEDNAYALAGADAGSEVLTEMMSDIRTKNVIFTNIVPSGMGQPPQVMPAKGWTMTDRLTDVWMQVGEDGRIVARIKAFNAWLVDHNYSPPLIRKRLAEDYTIVTRKVQIGVGLAMFANIGRANCYDLTPKKKVNHTPSSPSSSFGSPSDSTPAS